MREYNTRNNNKKSVNNYIVRSNCALLFIYKYANLVYPLSLSLLLLLFTSPVICHIWSMTNLSWIVQLSEELSDHCNHGLFSHWRANRESENHDSRCKRKTWFNSATKAQKEACFKKKTVTDGINEKASKLRIKVHVIDLAAWPWVEKIQRNKM